ncbi:hypothetical protein WN944_018317 [Citrus x changshan-huyou]|uniref:Uncharacterized protein n=1 Tax=Citrus x changshan-huyou TaxID=2935761 RepID=A0AAP0LTV5_9ROSI
MATTATSNTETTKVKLKLMIDKRANKVLFAEAEKDFVDVLFDVLICHLVVSPGSSRMLPQACPRPVPVERKLYNCANNHRCLTNEVNTRCLQCDDSYYESAKMRHEVQQWQIVSDIEGGVVKKSFACMITDDLSITPASVISATGLLQGKIKDIGALEERVVDVGPDEVLELLNASMQTNEALTTVFLPQEEEVSGMKMIDS